MRRILLIAAAGLLLLTACATPGPPRDYFEGNIYARYYVTQSGDILRVDPDGAVLNVTCLEPKLAKTLPRQELSKLPCKGERVGVIGRVSKVGEDWDMSGYDIDPETGTCKSLFPYFQDEWLDGKRQSCWHRVWEVPAAIVVYPTLAVLFVGVITAPIWAPLLLF